MDNEEQAGLTDTDRGTEQPQVVPEVSPSVAEAPNPVEDPRTQAITEAVRPTRELADSLKEVGTGMLSKALLEGEIPKLEQQAGEAYDTEQALLAEQLKNQETVVNGLLPGLVEHAASRIFIPSYDRFQQMPLIDNMRALEPGGQLEREVDGVKVTTGHYEAIVNALKRELGVEDGEPQVSEVSESEKQIMREGRPALLSFIDSGSLQVESFNTKVPGLQFQTIKSTNPEFAGKEMVRVSKVRGTAPSAASTELKAA